MRDHHRGNAVLTEGAKRHQFQSREVRHIVVDNGQIEVAVHVRIAVSGEVFGARHDVVILHTFGVSETFCGNIVHIIAKTAVVDDGIVRVVVDVNRRRKIDMHAEPPTLFADDFAKSVDKSIVGNRAEHNLFRIGNSR